MQIAKSEAVAELKLRVGRGDTTLAQLVIEGNSVEVSDAALFAAVGLPVPAVAAAASVAVAAPAISPVAAGLHLEGADVAPAGGGGSAASAAAAAASTVASGRKPAAKRGAEVPAAGDAKAQKT